MIDIETLFEKHKNEYLHFNRAINKLHVRPDICAFLLLDKLLPHGDHKMVAGAEHDEIYLDVNLDKLAQVATEEDIILLLRCGVSFDEETGLGMFV